MPKFNPSEILKTVRKEGFEKAWLESSKLLKLKGRALDWRKEEGKTHPIMDLVWKIRQIIFSYGFEELINPTIVDETEVYRQYGPEAPVILDRCFYLAGLPRPDIGLSRKKEMEIQKFIPNFSGEKVEELQRIFREYKRGKIGGDNLVEAMVNRLNVETEHATAILSLFPELAKLTPIPLKLTLRSHMTALWFPVLASLQDKKPLPMKLYSIGIKYRREQKLDEMHLYESFIASMVVMAEEVTLEDGVELTRSILSDLGFKNVRFEVKRATSKYYAPRTEMEVFVKSNGQWVEVGDIGLYSPVSLARYNIRYPVFNAGLGVERIAMLTEGLTDIRKLTYPQLYMEVEYTDRQLAKMIKVAEKPSTNEGMELVKLIVETAVKHADEPSPCEFLAYKGKFLNRNIEVYVYESDVRTRLLGPAALNAIYVYDGNILGIPEKGLEEVEIVKEARKRGIPLGIRYLDAVAALAAAKLEREAFSGRTGETAVRVKVAKNPSDVNIEIDEAAKHYITSRKKKIMVKGPVFIGVKARIY
jgi:O-phosphoseryl-tRNA synthetase